MFSKKGLRVTRKLAFRLTLWYAVIFTVSCFGALTVFYLATASVIHYRTDLELTKDAKEFSSVYEAKGIAALQAALSTEMESEGADNMFLRLRDGQGSPFRMTLPRSPLSH